MSLGVPCPRPRHEGRRAGPRPAWGRRDPEGERPQEPAGQLRGVLARFPRGLGRRRGLGPRGPDVLGSPACGRGSASIMAVTDGLLLHLSEPPAAAAAFRTFSRPRVAQARRVSSDSASGPSAPTGPGPRRAASCRLASESALESFSGLRGESQTSGSFWESLSDVSENRSPSPSSRLPPPLRPPRPGPAEVSLERAERVSPGRGLAPAVVGGGLERKELDRGRLPEKLGTDAWARVPAPSLGSHTFSLGHRFLDRKGRLFQE